MILVKSRIDDKKPRREGLTYIVDKLQGIDKDNFEILSPMIDVVKIYGAFPLLIPETTLERKIKFYHDFDILVSTGRMRFTEYAIMENSFDRFTTDAKIGFDIIEIGENSIDLSPEQKEKIAQAVKSKNNLDYHCKVGREKILDISLESAGL